jgi:hypothetical protein
MCSGAFRAAKNCVIDLSLIRHLHRRPVMLYMMLPLDRHFDSGFGAVADSFRDAADALEDSRESTPTLNAHLPVSFLYRHAIELFLKSAIIIFHRKLNIPYGAIPASGEPQIPIGEKWKPMHNVHGLQPLYQHFCSLFEDHAEYLASHTNTDWSLPTELGQWISEIEATDSSSTFFRYPVTKDKEKDKQKSVIREDDYDALLSRMEQRYGGTDHDSEFSCNRPASKSWSVPVFLYADDHPLFVDTSAPLHILLDTAGYRIRAVTQLLENLAMRGDIPSDSVVLQDFAQLCCIPLRDGCDVLDVIARRLDAEPA